MALDKNWFTELCEEGGSAFSMKLVKKLHEEKTPYQHIEIYQTEFFGNLMAIDGFVMLTERDNFIYHEMISHPALFCHPAPRKVVVIGGGDCGTLQEVLKHEEVLEAWQVEIDERVTRLAEAYFPALCQANNDSRANFFFGDGIKWMEEAEPESIDLIIVDSTDPIGPAEGLFSEPFYRNCQRALTQNGLVVQQSESPLFHLDILTGMRDAMRAAGFNNLMSLQFPQCTYPSGWWTATLAGKDINLKSFREDAAANRPFKTSFYNVEMHRAAMALPQFMKEAFKISD